MCADTLKIISANTQGLKTKVLEVINKLKSHDVALVQEINVLDKKDLDYIKSLYNGCFFYNKPNSGTRATGIFIHKRIIAEAETVEHKIIISGQAHQVKIKLHTSSLLFLNIYGCPDHDGNVILFKKIKENILNEGNYSMIMGGDYNTITDKINDQENYSETGLRNIEKGAKQLTDIVQNMEMVDIFRFLNPNKKEFTFFKCKPNKTILKSRLDRIYVTKQDVSLIKKHSFIPLEFSDHIATEISYLIPYTIHYKPSHWKLNVSLLSDQKLVDDIKQIVRDWRQLKQLFPNKVYWWESLKLRIKTIIREYGKEKKKIEQNTVNDLNSKLFNVYNTGIDNEEEMCTLLEIKHKLREINKNQAKSLKIRSREEEIEKDETMSSYFFRRVKENLNKHNFIGLKDINGRLKTGNAEMRNVVYHYYSNLYTDEETNEVFQEELLARDNSRLTNDDRETCEGLLTVLECKKSVFQMKSGKTPGSDGLSAEFYQTFWEFMGEDITECLNDVYIHGELSESQRLALITLLYKKNSIYDLGNWRPISLLNVDFKIITKCLSNRLRNVLPKLIIKFQTCGVRGRSITDNIIAIQNMIELCNQTHKNMLLVSLDQLKAFDRLDHNWMFKVLNHYNFGSSFTKWINILYTDISSKGIVNGYLTKSIKIKRGVRQGCPLSPLLYILAMNPIANDILCDTSIEGISSNPTPRSISQYIQTTSYAETFKLFAYADDMNCTLTNTSSVNTLLKKFDKYEKISGSKLNIKKTEIMLIGRQPITQSHGFSFQDNMKILGVKFNKNGVCQDQWTETITKIKSLLQMWSTRKLTTRGRAILATTVGLSQLWYLARVIPITKTQCKEIEKHIFHFIWNREYDPIRREVAYLPYSKGGLNIPNIKFKCDLLLAQRISYICSPSGNKFWAELSLFWLRDALVPFNPQLRTTLRPKSQILPELYKSIIKTYQSYQRKCPTDWTDKSVKDLCKGIQSASTETPVCTTKEQGFDWNLIWTFMKPFDYDKYVWDISWGLIHGILPTGEHKSKRHLLVNNNDNKCYFCEHFETNTHLFYECYYAKEVINLGKNLIRTKTGYDEPIEVKDFINHAVYRIPVSKADKKIITQVWAMIKYVIWKYRAIIKNGEIPSKIMIRVHFKIESKVRGF